MGFDFDLKTEVFLRLFDPSGCGISAFLSHQHLLPHKGRDPGGRDGGMEGWRDGWLPTFRWEGMISPVIVAYSAMMSEGLEFWKGVKVKETCFNDSEVVEDSFDRYPWSFWVVNKHCESRGIG